MSIICYPPPETATISFVEGSLKPEADGTIIVLDDQADGADITNNVELAGDDIVLFGQGPAVSVVGGNLKVTGDRVVVRGVTVEGEVDLEGTDIVLTSCVIHGNLHIQGNGATVSDCTVFGDVDFDAEGGNLVRNLAQKNWNVPSEKTSCSGNRGFTDEDNNLLVAAEEIGDGLSCPSR